MSVLNDTHWKQNALATFCAIWVMAAWAGPGAAQQLQALARLDAGQSSVSARISGDVDVVLKLTQAVPFRVFTLSEPARLVLDFQEVDFGGVKARDIIHTQKINGLRHGLFRPGWSRLVLDMTQPMRVATAEMQTDPAEGDAIIRVRLTPGEASAPETDQTGIWSLPKGALQLSTKTRPTGDRKIVVALDPGHGGIDPGAQYQPYTEADLMLQLAREMKEVLVLSGRYDVFLTREEDVFLSLQGRITRARDQGADILISLHADALAEGRASGTTVYTLSDIASDGSAASLASSHERDDLLAGVDLAQQDDLVASVLIDLARIETMPRSESLAEALVAGIAQSIGKIRSRPRLSAGFSVLKAPDIPSVLIEFGFMSNPKDLANLANPDWRAKAITGVLAALDVWGLQDAAQARLLRQ